METPSTPPPTDASAAVAPAWLTASSVRLLFACALAVGLLLRVVGLSYPAYDAHCFRQTQTLSTIDDFYARGIDLLRAKTIYSGYPGTFVLELPLFQAIATILYRLFGPHIEAIRLLNICFGAGTTLLLYRIVAYLLDRPTALLAATIYWLAPLNVLYHRSVLIDPMAVFLALFAFHELFAFLGAGWEAPFTGPKPAPAGPILLFALMTCLTALIKALYLWPAVLLFLFALWRRRFKLDVRLVSVGAIFAFAGLLFFAWNLHAVRVNNEAPFTRGVNPTTLLGVSALLKPSFYLDMLVRRPKLWLGVLGALLYPVGVLAAFKDRASTARTSALLLLFLIPPTYLILFSSINSPHDYYQLIIAPFLATASAIGLVWLLARRPHSAPTWDRFREFAPALALGLLILAAPVTYLFWKHQPQCDISVLAVEKLCAGKFDPWAPAMMFVDAKTSSRSLGSYTPEFLYAARIWGYASAVDNAESAKGLFETFGSGCHGLRYLVFYGTACPHWPLAAGFQLESSDNTHQLHVFKAGATTK